MSLQEFWQYGYSCAQPNVSQMFCKLEAVQIKKGTGHFSGERGVRWGTFQSVDSTGFCNPRDAPGTLFAVFLSTGCVYMWKQSKSSLLNHTAICYVHQMGMPGWLSSSLDKGNNRKIARKMKEEGWDNECQACKWCKTDGPAGSSTWRWR